MNALLLVIMSWGSFALATERLGEIRCQTLDNPSYLVRAEMFGVKSVNETRIEFANIVLTSYNEDTQKESKPLGSWKRVPNYKGSDFLEHFKNAEIELDAFYDDVGAMSTFKFAGNEQSMGCDISFNRL